MSKKKIDILLIEDNNEDAELTLRFFTKNDVGNVEHLPSADDALNLLQSESNDLPRIILVDLGLDGTNGTDLIRKIKEDDRLKNIAVIVLTGSTSEMDIINTFRLRVDGHLIKPLDVFKLKKNLTIAGLHNN